jgi:hypothetical protein
MIRKTVRIPPTQISSRRLISIEYFENGSFKNLEFVAKVLRTSSALLSLTLRRVTRKRCAGRQQEFSFLQSCIPTIVSVLADRRVLFLCQFCDSESQATDGTLATKGLPTADIYR